MTFPVVESSTTSTEDSANVTSHTVDYPSGINDGDLLLCFMGFDGSPVINFPAGWTEIEDNGYATDTVTHAVAWRAADGAETGTFEVSSNGNSQRSSHCTFRISGAADPAVQPPEMGGKNGGSSNNANPGELVPTGGAKDYLWFAAYARDRDDVNTGWPTNYSTINGENQDGGGANSCGETAAWYQNNAASEDPGAFTMDGGGDGWGAGTVAVHPVVLSIAPKAVHHMKQMAGV